MNSFFIIATPIGNLEDITLRALRILKEVDLVLCEDTRVSRILLEKFNIKTQLLSYHQHSRQDKIDYILENLREKNVALVTDSGTPGISDPGNKLIEEAFNKFKDELKIIPVPGPSALTAMASVSGFAMDKFLFLGFPPAKNKRKKFFEKIAFSEFPVIFYESSYKILRSLTDLELLNKNFKIVVGRELTKKFETIYRGNTKEVMEKIKKDPIKGEFVIIVKNE